MVAKLDFWVKDFGKKIETEKGNATTDYQKGF